MKESFSNAFNNTKKTLAGFTAEGITAIPRVEIINRKVLQEAREWLKHGSIVVYFGPHTCVFDPAITTQRILMPHLINKSDSTRFAWFTSSKFTGTDTEKPTMGLASTAAAAYANRMGFEMLPLVQTYRQSVTEQEAAAINMKSLREALNILKTPGGIVALSPEGTRGTTGGLLRGNEGLRVLLKSRSALALPIVLNGVHQMQARDKSGLNGLHPFVKISACIGKLISHSQAEDMARKYSWVDISLGEFTVADALMVHLAATDLTPWQDNVDPRGVYAWDNIQSKVAAADRLS